MHDGWPHFSGDRRCVRRSRARNRIVKEYFVMRPTSSGLARSNPICHGRRAVAADDRRAGDASRLSWRRGSWSPATGPDCHKTGRGVRFRISVPAEHTEGQDSRFLSALIDAAGGAALESKAGCQATNDLDVVGRTGARQLRSTPPGNRERWRQTSGSFAARASAREWCAWRPKSSNGLGTRCQRTRGAARVGVPDSLDDIPPLAGAASPRPGCLPGEEG